MASENDRFSQINERLERARHYRNRWVAIYVGGMATCAAIAIATGDSIAAECGAAGVLTITAGPAVAAAQGEVSSYRGALRDLAIPKPHTE